MNADRRLIDIVAILVRKIEPALLGRNLLPTPTMIDVLCARLVGGRSSIQRVEAMLSKENADWAQSMMKPPKDETRA
jgi:hypothetical protein